MTRARILPGPGSGGFGGSDHLSDLFGRQGPRDMVERGALSFAREGVWSPAFVAPVLAYHRAHPLIAQAPAAGPQPADTCGRRGLRSEAGCGTAGHGGVGPAR